MAKKNIIDQIGELADKGKETEMVVAEFVKGAGEGVNEFMNEKKNESLMETYQPVTAEVLNDDDFKAPKIVYIVDVDKHSDVEIFKGALGYRPKIAKSRVFELIKDRSKSTPYVFIPNSFGGIYYQNPYKENEYIKVKEYFEHIKNERIEELKRVAHAIGAQSIEIRIIEDEKKKIQAGAKKDLKGPKTKDVKINSGISAGLQYSDINSKDMEYVAKFNKKEGFIPERPELVYFKNDSSVKNLIDMALSDNPLMDVTYKIESSQSKDMSISAAAELDAVLGKLSLNDSVSMKASVEKEQRSYFKCHLTF